MVEIERCKYLLPCGYCDKYNIPCKASKKDLMRYYGIAEEDEEKCEHEWRYKGKNEIGHYYKCIKCDTMKVIPLGSLYSDDLYFTDKECKHDWHINGQLHGKEARYTMHTCSKCGKEETLKTYINEDGKWTTHSV